MMTSNEKIVLLPDSSPEDASKATLIREWAVGMGLEIDNSSFQKMEGEMKYLVEHIQPGRGYPLAAVEADSLDEARQIAGRWVEGPAQKGALNDIDEDQGLVGI